jgi:hypothetical protein
MSASFSTADKAGQLIAQFIEKSWPNDKEVIFNVLSLVNEEIWNSGLFPDSTKWAYVKVGKNGTITNPHGYSVLLGAKIDCDKFEVKDSYFMFHSNGPLREPDESSSFSKSIQFLGTYPTLINPQNDYMFKCGDKGFNIGVSACNLPPSRYPPLTIISGLNLGGRPIYTYRFENTKSDEVRIADDDEITNYTPDDVDFESGLIEGVQFPITNKLIKFSNVAFSDIYNIVKQPTLTDVDYWMVDEATCKAIKIATLGPFQTRSAYNIYRIDNKCINSGCAFTLFKREKPDPIINDSQFILTNNQNALISMAKGVYLMYFKEDINTGTAFITKALRDIGRELTQSNPAASNKIQVEDISKYAKNRRFK